LGIVVRQALSRVRHLELARDHRDAAGALRSLEEPGLLIIDAELLRDPSSGAALGKAIATRREATILLDARGSFSPGELPASSAVVVLRGQRQGELDLGFIETELGEAVAGARRRLDFVATSESRELPATTSGVEAYDGPLELIVLGVSTGGPTLLLQLLPALDPPTVPVLVVQHMADGETRGFATRLAEESRHRVVEVTAGPLPPANTIGIVRGGNDVRVAKRATGELLLRGTTLVSSPFHPNIDEALLSAVAAEVTLGAAILTGMGQDGTLGAIAMAKKGLPVIAQRPDTCAVGGMPQSVIDAGAARFVQSPEMLARTLNRWFAAVAMGTQKNSSRAS
jgi:two-component system chemotaxis response regulator CheB